MPRTPKIVTLERDFDLESPWIGVFDDEDHRLAPVYKKDCRNPSLFCFLVETIAAAVSWWLEWIHRYFVGTDASVPVALTLFKNLGTWTLLTFAFIFLILDLIEILKKRWRDVFGSKDKTRARKG